MIGWNYYFFQGWYPAHSFIVCPQSVYTVDTRKVKVSYIFFVVINLVFT